MRWRRRVACCRLHRPLHGHRALFPKGTRNWRRHLAAVRRAGSCADSRRRWPNYRARAGPGTEDARRQRERDNPADPGESPARSRRTPAPSRPRTVLASSRFAASELAATRCRPQRSVTPGHAACRCRWRIEIVTLTAAKADGTVTLLLSRTGGIAGKVTNATGAPMVGVPVRVLRAVVVSPRVVWQPIPTIAMTDKDGDYRFTNAPPSGSTTSPACTIGRSPCRWPCRRRCRIPPPGRAPRFCARVSPVNATLFSLPPSGGSTGVGKYRWSIFDALDRPALPSSAQPGDALNASSLTGSLLPRAW